MSITLSKICKECKRPFETSWPTKFYCSKRCSKRAEDRRGRIQERRIRGTGSSVSDYVCQKTGYAGLSGWRRGCRCDGCRAEKSKRNADYRERNREKFAAIQAKANKLHWLKKPLVPRCSCCSKEMQQRLRERERTREKSLRDHRRRQREVDFHRKLIGQAISLWGNQYEYFGVFREGNGRLHFWARCKKHNQYFYPKVDEHLGRTRSGKPQQYCPKCAEDRDRAAREKSANRFFELAKKYHGDRYDYSKAVYVNHKEPVCIICPTHGEFRQTPEIHTKRLTRDGYTSYGCGCPKCKRSIGEERVASELTRLNIRFEEQWKCESLAAFAGHNHFRFDFYLPDLNSLIEFHGQQHYIQSGNSWGTPLEEVQRRDGIKANWAAERGIPLHVISYREMSRIPERIRAITSAGVQATTSTGV